MFTYDPQWRDRAACGPESGIDPDLFFPLNAGHDSPEVLAATRVCRTCPVVWSCLQWAVDHPRETDAGVWGGTTHLQRRALRRRRAGWAA